MVSFLRAVAATVAILAFIAAAPAAAEVCDSSSQVCDYSEIEEEMRRAASRGSAFIQAKRSRSAGKRQRQAADLQQRVGAYDAAVQKQVSALTQRYGADRVSHKRSVGRFQVSKKEPPPPKEKALETDPDP